MNSHDRASEPHALESEAAFPMMASRVDLLSQVLTLIRLRGELIFSADLTAPWALRFDPGSAYFHVVSDGEVRLEASDGKVVHAVAGDLLVMPQGRGHLIGTPGAEPVAAGDVLTAQMREDSLAIRHGGNGTATRLITGAFRFEGDNMPSMLAVLPSVIHIPTAARTEDAGWLEGIAQYLLAEARTPHPGSSLMISRLIDVLVIRAMRVGSRTYSAPSGPPMTWRMRPRFLNRISCATSLSPFNSSRRNSSAARDATKRWFFHFGKRLPV